MKNKINVLHLISSLQVGGAEKLLISQLKANKDSDINLTVVVLNDLYDEKLKQELLDTSYEIYFLERKQSSKNPLFLFKLLEIVIGHKINVIHSHNYGSKIWGILCKLCCPFLKNVHTVHDTNLISRYNKLNLLLHRCFIDKNIAISRSVYDECINFNIKKTVVINNGIDLSQYKYRNSKEENRYFKIINVSRLNYHKKGQDILIKALKICKEKGLCFECNFVGGESDYSKNESKYLKELVISLNLEKEINFLGNRNDVPALLSESDLFVLTSRYEGFGLVVIEAMASGLPVIASNIDGPAELIKNNENGLLFESENETELVRKIIKLHENKELRAKIVENAQRKSKQFDILIMVKKYNELYRNS